MKLDFDKAKALVIEQVKAGNFRMFDCLFNDAPSISHTSYIFCKNEDGVAALNAFCNLNRVDSPTDIKFRHCDFEPPFMLYRTNMDKYVWKNVTNELSRLENIKTKMEAAIAEDAICE